MSRSKARQVAMCMLYSELLGGAETPADVCEKIEERDALDQEDLLYVEQVVAGVQAHAADVDALIGEHAVGWSLERIARVDLSILRVAVYEMLYRDDVPVGASINEAVELAKRYGGEKSFAFINGILGAISRRPEDPADG